MRPVVVFFHPDQLAHRPLYEWAFGDKLAHPEISLRAQRILETLEPDARFRLVRPRRRPMAALRALHDARLLTLYRTAAKRLAPGQTYDPNVFPHRARTRPDPRRLAHAGWFSLDSGTPLQRTTLAAAAWSAACAWEAAGLVLSGRDRLAYALCRPPGHHASRGMFGGYCYFNNAALAARRLRPRWRVAILDIDFHHGNGTQEIFYADPRVFFASLHGDPREFYPYFSGYAHETGKGRARGTTLNVPLPRGTDGRRYLAALERRVLPALRAFGPGALVVSAGFDTYADDPIGSFRLQAGDFSRIGERIGALGVPTVVVQEGGYFTNALGPNVAAFLTGLRSRVP